MDTGEEVSAAVSLGRTLLIRAVLCETPSCCIRYTPSGCWSVWWSA